MTHFIIAYHIYLMKVQANYFNNNLLIFDVKQLKNHTLPLKAPWDGQCKIKMYYGLSRVKNQLSRKRSYCDYGCTNKMHTRENAFYSCYFRRFVGQRFFFQTLKKLALLFGFYESSLDFQRREEKIFFMRSKIYF